MFCTLNLGFALHTAAVAVSVSQLKSIRPKPNHKAYCCFYRTKDENWSFTTITVSFDLLFQQKLEISPYHMELILYTHLSLITLGNVTCIQCIASVGLLMMFVLRFPITKLLKQHTLTGGDTPRPHSCSLTCVNVLSHQNVACVTTVGGCLSKCCSSRVTNLTIGWVSQSATVHSC